MNATDNAHLDLLLRQAAGGNEGAFRKFYELTSPFILAILLRLTRDRLQAEDLLQDAMVTAWSRAHDFDASKASAKTWLTAIARHKALDVLRGQRRRNEILRDDAEDIRTTLGLAEGSAATQPESTVTEKRLAECLSALQPDMVTCIRLAYLDGLTFSEIAQRLERSMGTVKSWVRRGMAKLKGCMQR